MFKGSIVITSINKPTEAIIQYAEICKELDYKLIIVGDKKTPNESYDGQTNLKYLSLEEQLDNYGEFALKLPINHYCRKNIGYLEALRYSKEVIVDTDDDNLPYDNYKNFINKYTKGITSTDVIGKDEWINIYKHFTDKNIWPRGNPLSASQIVGEFLGCTEKEFKVIQGLADADPDVDAIYRLLNPEDKTYFRSNYHIALDKLTWCSFNSQNTIFKGDFIKYMYLPCHVSFRMTDIWRSFIVQLMLWKNNTNLLFTSPSVYQERNEHNLQKDFEQEIIGYRSNEYIGKLLLNHLDKNKQLSNEDFYLEAWKVLKDNNYITSIELELIVLWMNEIDRYV